jgi:hypothetical protein
MVPLYGFGGDGSSEGCNEIQPWVLSSRGVECRARPLDTSHLSFLTNSHDAVTLRQQFSGAAQSGQATDQPTTEMPKFECDRGL